LVDSYNVVHSAFSLATRCKSESSPWFKEEEEMRLRMIPNYPRGVEAVQWRLRGVLCWSVYYTQPDTIGAKERLLGTIRRPVECSFVVPNCEHPPLRTLNQAVWWLYGLSVGLPRTSEHNDNGVSDADQD